MNKQLELLLRQFSGIGLKLCLIIIMCFGIEAGLSAQSGHQVTGIVSAGGEPLIGASVAETGTTNGTFTDIDGKFTLNLKSANTTLTVTYLGYTSKTISVNGQSSLTIEMEEDENVLEEVVAIGYGVQKKKLNTGATLQVKGDDISRLNTTNPLQALQGQTPGVTITSTSGQPGSDMKVTIRGLGTIGNSGPLYIIDGIEGDISTINASDIESIDVLKDAASAAIYGSQSANGVVLVTTKSGRVGKAQVTFDGYFGVQSAIRKAKMLNSEQYMAIMSEQALNSGSAAFNFSPDNYPDIYNADGSVINTNWVDQMFEDNAITQGYNLGISGGNNTSIYNMSLGYLNQEGIVGGKDVSYYERYNFRFNSQHNLYDNFLKIGQHAAFIYTRNNGVSVGNQYSNTLRGAFAASPLAPVYSDNNIYDSPYNDTSNSSWYNGDGNPYGSMMTNNNNQNDGQKFVADIYAEIEPVKDLKLKSLLGINYYSSEYRSYTPLYRFSIYSYNEAHTSVNQNMSKGHTITMTNTASYDFTLKDDHRFNALAGMEVVRYRGTYVGAGNWDLKPMFNDWQHAYVDNTENTTSDGKTVSGRAENNSRRASFFGRLGYNYKEKYMLNVTLRADGSSKFARGNRWGYFPSVSAGWNLTSEDFMASVLDVMDYFKFRASWGQVGNQNIDDFQFAAPIKTTNTNYIFGTEGLGAEYNQWGAYPNRLANPNLKWETSEQTNIGFDARFLYKLNVNADFYIKKTKDWLVVAPVLGTVGTGAPYINGGDVKNTGFELALNWSDNINNLKYTVGVNGSYNKNKVGKIPTDDPSKQGFIDGQTNMLYDNSEVFYRAQDNHAIGYFRGYKTAGIFQNQQQIDDWVAAGNGVLQANPQPGDVIFMDLDKNGVIDDYDKADLGNGMPDFTLGFNLLLEYKDFDFSLNANGMIGNKIVQSYRNYANAKANYTTEILSRWTGEGTSNRIPRVTDTNINWQFSDLYVHDGDFLRISNITLGYDFSRMINYKHISQMRLYLQVQNAFTFTKYNGMDPEIGYGTDGWVSGVDLGYYPRPRTFLIGANIKF